MNWQCPCVATSEEQFHTHTVTVDGIEVTRKQFLLALQDSEELRQQLTKTLAQQPFRAFRWETPAICHRTENESFEFTVLNAPSLERLADPSSFTKHFNAHEDPVLTFLNLRGDATMIVPRPLKPESMFAHLAAFVRNAPSTQIDQLWQTIGATLCQQIEDNPRWLSTAGMGVPWLHVRIDSQPKYYAHTLYRNASYVRQNE